MADDDDKWLTLFETWLANKYRVAQWLIIGNGATLATAISSYRTKGEESLSYDAMVMAITGLSCAVLGLGVTWLLAEAFLEHLAVRRRDNMTGQIDARLLYSGLFRGFFVACMVASLGFFFYTIGLMHGYVAESFYHTQPPHH